MPTNAKAAGIIPGIIPPTLALIGIAGPDLENCSSNCDGVRCIGRKIGAVGENDWGVLSCIYTISAIVAGGYKETRAVEFEILKQGFHAVRVGVADLILADGPAVTDYAVEASTHGANLIDRRVDHIDCRSVTVVRIEHNNVGRWRDGQHGNDVAQDFKRAIRCGDCPSIDVELAYLIAQAWR